MNKVLKIFLELVQIDSPSGYESEVAGYVQKYLTSIGIKNSKDKEGNVFAKIEGTGTTVLIGAHMDTVEPGQGIKPIVSNGFVKSSGDTILGADDKAALAAILAALTETKSSKRKNLEILFSVREETESGASLFDFKKIKSREGLISDSGYRLGTVILSTPNICDIKIEIIGKAAHSSIPESGIDSIKIASLALSKIKLGRVDEVTTVNIGLIQGGTTVNTIPERVTLIGEVRSFDIKGLKSQVKEIKETFKKVVEEEGAKMKFEFDLYCKGYTHKESDPHVVKVADLLRKMGLSVYYKNSFGGSDANIFNEHGIRIVDIGYEGYGTHTVNERIPVKSLVTLKDIFKEYILC